MSTATKNDDKRFSVIAGIVALMVMAAIAVALYFIGYGIGKAEVESKVCAAQGGTYDNGVGCYDPMKLDY